MFSNLDLLVLISLSLVVILYSLMFNRFLFKIGYKKIGVFKSTDGFHIRFFHGMVLRP